MFPSLFTECIDTDIDVVRLIKMQRLRWLAHVVRMDENAPARKVFDNELDGRRRRGQPKLRWKDQDTENLAELCVSN